jgi:hypothetical protein
VKGLFIGFGALVLAFGLTFSDHFKHFLDPALKDHLRLGHYINFVYMQYKTNDKSSLGPIDFLKTDKTHGLVGLDPWGNPYEFFIEKLDSKTIQITLWSKGEDLKSLLSYKDLKESRYKKQGDDFIFTQQFKI